MKLSKKKLNNDQPKTLSSRDDKKSVNIKWNSKLFFQLSLIACLLMAYFAIQTEFEIKESAIIIPEDIILEEPLMINYRLEEPIKIKKKKEIITKPKTIAKVIENIKKTDNNSDIETDLSDLTEPDNEKDILPVNPGANNKKMEEKKPYNLVGVEHVPVFPGCEDLSSNIEKRNCMSKKIKSFIQKKFNADKFDDINTKGRQTIYVQFYIDETGLVTDVIARAIDKSLEKEAIRVVSKLPKMEAGRQGDKAVKVQYMIPIVFKID